MEGYQQQVPGHGDVLQGREEELEAMAGGRGTEEHGSDLSGLWETLGDGVRAQITWEEYHSIRWQLAGSGCKPEEVAEVVVADVKDIRVGGIIPPDVWEILQGGGEGKPPAQSRDLGNDPQGWE